MDRARDRKQAGFLEAATMTQNKKKENPLSDPSSAPESGTVREPPPFADYKDDKRRGEKPKAREGERSPRRNK
jgi:hypothetical protein